MKYKCIKDWVRVSKGTVIDEYEYRRLPQEIKETHFQSELTHFVKVEDVNSVEVEKNVENDPIVDNGTATHLDIDVNFTEPTQVEIPTLNINNQSVAEELEKNAKKLHKKFGNKKDTL